MAVETLVKPDNAFSIRPGNPLDKTSGVDSAKSLAPIRRESGKIMTRIRQEPGMPRQRSPQTYRPGGAVARTWPTMSPLPPKEPGAPPVTRRLPRP